MRVVIPVIIIVVVSLVVYWGDLFYRRQQQFKRYSYRLDHYVRHSGVSLRFRIYFGNKPDVWVGLDIRLDDPAYDFKIAEGRIQAQIVVDRMNEALISNRP